MLTLGIRYLTGCVVASDVADRNHVEWPPHPGRVFMAMAAACFQTGEDPGERAALEQIEQLGAPQISAPEHLERAVVTHYVPVNDKAGPSKAPLQSAAGLTRGRQPRTFARAWLADDTVYMVWPQEQPEAYFPALERLCGKVTRVGHSISLVQMWASQSSPEKPVNWVPNEDRPLERFRVPGRGFLNNLVRRFNASEIEEYFKAKETADHGTDKKQQKEAKKVLKERFHNETPVRLRPELSLSAGYAHPAGTKRAVSGTVFDPRLFIYKLKAEQSSYRYLDLTATLQLTAGFRKALLSQLHDDIPEILSGHNGTAKADHPHVAFFPLPFVGREYAHGGILGIAVAVPKDMSFDERQRLLKALSGLRNDGLKLGALGVWSLDPADVGVRVSLQTRTWTAFPGGARQWATVTPYVYDRHSKAKDKAAYEQEIADSIRDSWRRVRQPEDDGVEVDVIVTPVSAHLGAPASHEFPRLPRKDGSECRHTHAILTFDRPVTGPVLIGAGRFRGYGLCRPLEAER